MGTGSVLDGSRSRWRDKLRTASPAEVVVGALWSFRVAENLDNTTTAAPQRSVFRAVHPCDEQRDRPPEIRRHCRAVQVLGLTAPGAL
jgi:hypothetical protein